MLLLTMALVDAFCLEEGGFKADSTVKEIHAVVKKHILRMLSGQTSYDRLSRLFSYTQKRLYDRWDSPMWRWIGLGVPESSYRCGEHVWEEVYLAFPELATESDPAIVDSAEVLFIRKINDHIRSPDRYWGGSVRDTVVVAGSIAWDILAYSSFLDYLRWRGVENFREEFTCGYW